MKQIIKEYKDTFYNSLEKDNSLWHKEYCGAAGWNWVEYHSPDYANVSFVYTTLGKRCEVYVNGYRRFSFKVGLTKKLLFNNSIKSIDNRNKTAYASSLSRELKRANNISKKKGKHYGSR